MDDVEVVLAVPALLKMSTVAGRLGCSTRTVRRRIADGTIPALIEGDRIMVRSDELREFLVDIGHVKRFVYFIIGADEVKIGRSNRPEARLRDLRAGSPVPLTLARTIPTYAATDLERCLHRRYAEHRLHGEWFAAAPVLTDIARFDDATVATWASPDPLDENGP